MNGTLRLEFWELCALPDLNLLCFCVNLTVNDDLCDHSRSRALVGKSLDL